VDSVHLRNTYSNGHKKLQQAFLAPLPGKQLANDIVEWFDKDYCFIAAKFSGLTIALLSLRYMQSSV
jgi:hypothetical protein